MVLIVTFGISGILYECRRIGIPRDVDGCAVHRENVIAFVCGCIFDILVAKVIEGFEHIPKVRGVKIFPPLYERGFCYVDMRLDKFTLMEPPSIVIISRVSVSRSSLE